MKPLLRTATVLFIAITAGLGSACGERLEPQQVAERFWNAMLERDEGAVRLFVTRASRANLDPEADIVEIQAYRIVQTVIEGDSAEVLTEVVVAADEPVTLPLRTRLLVEDGQWRVDYRNTVSTIASDGEVATMIEKLRGMNRKFSEQVDESLTELQKAVPKIEQEFRQLEDELNAALPALKQALEDFARRLEEALEQPPEPQPGTPAPQQHEI